MPRGELFRRGGPQQTLWPQNKVDTAICPNATFRVVCNVAVCVVVHAALAMVSRCGSVGCGRAAEAEAMAAHNRVRKHGATAGLAACQW